MKQIIYIIALLLTFQVGFSQEKSFIEFQIGAIRSIPQSDLSESSKTELNSGKVTPSLSILYTHKVVNSHIYFTTGLNIYLKNTRVQQNIDTLTYYGIIYTQPKYRTISVPFLISFRKKLDFSFNPVSEKKRLIALSAGISFDFGKEVRIKNGMTIIGKNFNIKTSYKNNFAFKSTTGISFNSSIAFPVYNFKNKKSINFVSIYRYPFYEQNSLKLNYIINGDAKNFEIKRLRLQEISIGLNYALGK